MSSFNNDGQFISPAVKGENFLYESTPGQGSAKKAAL
jgi:hypothetical protein